jgi:hypothetical protein
MTIRSVISTLSASISVLIALAASGRAAVPRTFVSINGADTNPCSATQPCRSFNQALATVESGGEIVVQDSGGYSTGFTITQSVTIDAAGFNASVISIGGSDLCTINARPGDRVVMRGISFHGAGVGGHAINVIQAGSLYVEHCSIAEFIGNGVNMPNGGAIFVTSSDVRKCEIGISVAAQNGVSRASLVAHDSRFTECTEGVQLDTSGVGSFTGVACAGLLSDCAASLCTLNGFVALSDAAGSTVLTLARCQVAANNTGLAAQTTSSGGALIQLAGCSVTSNGQGIFTSQASSGIAAVTGTSPTSNAIGGNEIGNATGGIAPLLQ